MRLLNVGHVDDDGGVGGQTFDIAIRDPIIFVANCRAGLYAYTYDEPNYTNVGNINDVGGVECCRDLWVNATHIFAAFGGGGIRAYTYAGGVFTPAGNMFNGGSGFGVVSDGTHWFLANWTDGLRAYTYNGVAFVNVGHIDDGALGHLATGVGIIGPYIILANGPAGVYAYTFDGAVFTQVGHVDDGGAAYDVFVHDGLIYIPNSIDGLRIYDFDGVNFTTVGHVLPSHGWHHGHDVLIFEDHIILAAGAGGIYAYTWDGTVAGFTERAYRDDNHPAANAEGLGVLGDYLHLANAQDGVRAYKWQMQIMIPAEVPSLIIPETRLEAWGYDLLGPVPFNYRVYRGYAEDAYPAQLVTLPFQSRMIAATISDAPADLIISYDGITAEPERRFDTGFGRLDAAKAFMIKNHEPGNVCRYQIIPMI